MFEIPLTQLAVLRKPVFTYSPCGVLTKTKKELKNKAIVDWRYIYRNALRKSCFQYDIAYWSFQD